MITVYYDMIVRLAFIWFYLQLSNKDDLKNVDVY